MRAEGQAGQERRGRDTAGGGAIDGERIRDGFCRDFSWIFDLRTERGESEFSTPLWRR